MPVSVLGTGAAVVSERDEFPVRMKERSIVSPEGNSGNLFRLPSVLCRSPGCSDRQRLGRGGWRGESLCVGVLLNGDLGG